MKKSRELILSSLIDRKTKCKFTPSCSLFSNLSYTCTHTGGIYCGKYRKLSRPAENYGVQTGPYLVEIPQ